ncbi:hypothetical protein BD309DRAFT_121074 [Dichomitus squalens]|uniref:Uncharacterized protein n=1 Tax=Dichomitus squalens TaxID=114155 RepID=A0A4Q9P489_9APHY|nr:hypothetical protein BD309DRAFT_121074 [Dichomitus squalens]TBU60910.1 hypothetical protein BD310DRAFT_251350 [Dichomitus squalens]
MVSPLLVLTCVYGSFAARIPTCRPEKASNVDGSCSIRAPYHTLPSSSPPCTSAASHTGRRVARPTESSVAVRRICQLAILRAQPLALAPVRPSLLSDVSAASLLPSSESSGPRQIQIQKCSVQISLAPSRAISRPPCPDSAPSHRPSPFPSTCLHTDLHTHTDHLFGPRL